MSEGCCSDCGGITLFGGKDGRTIHNGEGPPNNATIENLQNGDLYIDTVNDIIYGPFNGTWGEGINLGCSEVCSEETGIRAGTGNQVPQNVLTLLGGNNNSTQSVLALLGDDNVIDNQSDHSSIVGSSNQLEESPNISLLGNSNTSLRTTLSLIKGNNNSFTDSEHSSVEGDNNTLINSRVNVIGDDNDIQNKQNAFIVGNNIDNSDIVEEGITTKKLKVLEEIDLPASFQPNIQGTQYILVSAKGVDTENALELQTAYNQAKTMSPSSTNRITIIAAPGNYNFNTGSFDMDTPFIDLVSFDGNKSIIFNAPLQSSAILGSINIQSDNVFVKGVNVLSKNFSIGDNLPNIVIENCKGGDYSFGGSSGSPIIVNGTIINCEGGIRSFCANGDAAGTFINCVGKDQSFGYQGDTSGKFKDCVGGQGSFSYEGSAVGIFERCIGGILSFGGGSLGEAFGTFINCQGDDGSFGGDNVFNGELYYCRLTAGTFNTTNGTGKIRACIDGNNFFIPNLDL